MNVVQAVKQYIAHMIQESGAGMKVLLMDKETISIVSMVYSQSEILQKEVYLFELLSNKDRESMKLLNTICFLRPTRENVELLSEELKSPKYNSYFVYFSNRLNEGDMKFLAESDEHESVKEIKEFYADFIAVGQHLFSFNIERCCELGHLWQRDAFERVSQGIVAVLLALKKNPLIRYTSSSSVTKRLADEIQRKIDRERDLFAFKCDIPPILLILDRKDDPVTPLLNQWTYQAMVHELLGIHNHRVDLSKVAGVKKEMQEVVLSAEQDDFYRDNMYLNFGDIGANIKELVDRYQEKSQSQAKVETIADMKKFVENFPEFRKLSGTVSKHVAVVSEMSRLVGENQLMAVSELEQDIVTQNDKSAVTRNLEGVFSNQGVQLHDCLRLSLLYALRFEGHQREVERLEGLLVSRGAPDTYRKYLKAIIEYGGGDKRTCELFESSTALSTAKRFFKLKGVENVYTRHKPQLVDTLERLVKGKLKEQLYPYTRELALAERPQDILVFLVGGATYEEALAVANFNKSTPGVRVLLGGTTIHNSKSFLREVESSSRSFARGSHLK